MARHRTAVCGVARMLQDHDEIRVWSDEHLLRLFLTRSGEQAEAAFASLIERYGSMVHRVCFDLLGEPEEAQDATQAVFLVLARNAGSIRNPESLGPWLYGVALRVGRRSRSLAARRKMAERRKTETTHERQTVDPGLGPMDYAELHREINQLPEKYRQPIILCYMQGQTQTQAAETLNWPLGTVQTRLHRGRERLRDRLTRRGVGLVGLSMAYLLTSKTQASTSPGHEWTDTTARAAVRFAAHQETTGLIKPAVTELAERVLAAPINMLLVVIALLLAIAAAGISSTTWAINGNHDAVSLPEAKTKTAGSTHVLPVLNPTKARMPGQVAKPLDQPSNLVIPQAPSSVDQNGVVKSPSTPTTSPGLAMMTLRLDKAPIKGRELFERNWLKDDPKSHGGDGLGPVFNASSCVDCHNLGGSGGGGTISRNIEIATVTEESTMNQGYSYSFSMDFGTGQFDYRFGNPVPASTRGQLQTDPRFLVAIHPGFKESRSVVLHRFGTDPAYHSWRESVPGRHGMVTVRISQRNSPPLFGMGLIDAIPGPVIEAAAKRKFPGSAQLKGRVSRLNDGRIGRFGWKAQIATLEEFVLSAAAGELGLELPSQQQATDPRLPGIPPKGLDMSEEECKALVDHVRNLSHPVVIKPVDDSEAEKTKAGETTFKSIGCTNCHVPQLGKVEGIYSDLLMHDMGGQTSDANTYRVFVNDPERVNPPPLGGRAGLASATEWRTPPLWGLRDSAPYMHDGRAFSIDQAIAQHSGQGASSARRYSDLSLRRKKQVEAFLLSLAAPPADR